MEAAVIIALIGIPASLISAAAALIVALRADKKVRAEAKKTEAEEANIWSETAERAEGRALNLEERIIYLEKKDVERGIEMLELKRQLNAARSEIAKLQTELKTEQEKNETLQLQMDNMKEWADACVLEIEELGGHVPERKKIET